jgi:hypothetical protein
VSIYVLGRYVYTYFITIVSGGGYQQGFIIWQT